MYKKITLLLVSLMLVVPTAIAQDVETEEESLPEFYTEIQSLDFAEINSPIVLTAKPQFDTDVYESVTYDWNFGDGNLDEGKEVAHTYADPGSYTVELTVNADGNEFKQNSDIAISVKAAVLITDQEDKQNRLNSIMKLAADNNIFIKQIESFGSQSEFLSEEVLVRKINKDEDTLKKVETMIVWTEGGAGLNALSRYQQAQENKSVFGNTSIILITNDIGSTRRVERQFSQLKPKEIILVQDAGLISFIDAPETSEFKEELSRSGLDFEVINEAKARLTPFNILSFFVDLLAEAGVPDNAIILILLLPLIATVIAFMKQVIGITTLGIYTPTIITLTFLILGLQFGIVVLFFIVAMGTLTHKVLRPLKLLYIPKMALVLIAVSLTIFLLLTTTVYLNLFDIESISFAIFPVVIMGTLTEKFVSLRSEKGLSASMIMMVETFFVSLVAYISAGGVVDLYFGEIKFNYLHDLILNVPEVMIIFVIINLYLGRWTGLRLTEYLQFRDVFKNIEE